MKKILESLKDLKYKRKSFVEAIEEIDICIRKIEIKTKIDNFSRGTIHNNYKTDVKNRYCKNCENFFVTNLDIDDAICPFCNKKNNICHQANLLHCILLINFVFFYTC